MLLVTTSPVDLWLAVLHAPRPGVVNLPLPATLSPSKIDAFKNCPLAFRYSAIDRIPSPPTVDMVRGTLVHRALELLHTEYPQGRRSYSSALNCLDAAWRQVRSGEEYEQLRAELQPEQLRTSLYLVAEALLCNYFTLEDPDDVNGVGFEVMLSMPLGNTVLRGVIDRLDLTPNGFVVVDYKASAPPAERYEAKRMAQVHLYAALVHHVLGVLPYSVGLMYLKGPVLIETHPTEQSVRGALGRAEAVQAAIERACGGDDFRPSPGPLCGWCGYTDRCPTRIVATAT